MVEWERGPTRRIYVGDVRGTDSFVRMTWHPDRRVVVISHWEGPVCTAATRMDIAEAGAVIGLLANALTDASRLGAEPTSVTARRPGDRVRATWRALVSRLQPRRAPVVELHPVEPGLRWAGEEPASSATSS